MAKVGLLVALGAPFLVGVGRRKGKGGTGPPGGAGAFWAIHSWVVRALRLVIGVSDEAGLSTFTVGDNKRAYDFLWRDAFSRFFTESLRFLVEVFLKLHGQEYTNTGWEFLDSMSVPDRHFYTSRSACINRTASRGLTF